MQLEIYNYIVLRDVAANLRGQQKYQKFPDEGRIHNLERMRPYVVFTAPTQTIALYHISSVRFN